MCFILWIYTSQLHSCAECWTQPYVVQKCRTRGVWGTDQLRRHQDEQGGRRHMVPTGRVRRCRLLFLRVEVSLINLCEPEQTQAVPFKLHDVLPQPRCHLSGGRVMSPALLPHSNAHMQLMLKEQLQLYISWAMNKKKPKVQGGVKHCCFTMKSLNPGKKKHKRASCKSMLPFTSVYMLN